MLFKILFTKTWFTHNWRQDWNIIYLENRLKSFVAIQHFKFIVLLSSSSINKQILILIWYFDLTPILNFFTVKSFYE